MCTFSFLLIGLKTQNISKSKQSKLMCKSKQSKSILRCKATAAQWTLQELVGATSTTSPHPVRSVDLLNTKQYRLTVKTNKDVQMMNDDADVDYFPSSCPVSGCMIVNTNN